MKGLNRKVIEIVETNSDFIERVIVILKPGVSGVSVRDNKAQVENYISKLTCKKRIWNKFTIGTAVGVTLISIILLLVLL